MATLLLGDCLEVMKGLADKSVDCFICDLPYGQLSQEKGATPFGRNTKGPSNSGCAWDVKLNLALFWEQVKRLAKNDHTPVLMFCNTKFGYDLINEAWFRYDLVWDKGRGVSFLLANKMPMKSHEMVYVFSKKGAFYRRVDIQGEFKAFAAKEDKDDKNTKCYSSGMPNGWKRTENDGTKRCPLSVIPLGGKSAGGHPTEKPLDLYKWLLERYVPDNGTVLDPTAGSFNAVIAARALGYKAIGIEKDATFFWKAVAKVNGIQPPVRNTLSLV
jgi:DNA modification methylase